MNKKASSYKLRIPLEQISSVTQKALFYVILIHVFFLPLVLSMQYEDIYDIPKYLFHLFFVSIESLLFIFTSLWKRGKAKKIRSKLMPYLLMFFVTYVLASLMSKNPLISVIGTRENWLLSIISIFSFLVFGYIFYFVVNSKSRLTLLAVVLILSADLAAGAGIITRYVLNDEVFSHANRISSTLGHPIDLGNFLALIIPVVLYFPAGESKMFSDSISKVFKYGSLVIQVAALILTFTRAAWISVVLIGVVFMLTSKPSLEIKGVRLGNRIFIIIMLFAISMLGFIPAVRNRVVSLFEGETGGNSLYLRFYEWKSAFKLFMKNIIFGVGPENVFLEFGKFRDAWLNKSSDWLLRVAYIRNTYLHFLVSTGLLGFGSFVLFVLLSLKNSLQILKCKVDLVTKGLMLGLISWFIVHIFYYPSIVTLLLLTIFMVVLIKRSGDTDNTLTKFVLNNRRLRFVKTGTLLLSSIVLFVYAFNFAKAELYFKKSLRQSDTVQSIRLIDVSIRHKPNEPSYYRQRAYYLSVTLTQGGYYDQDVVIKLVHNLNKAMQLGPDDLNNYDVAANIYYELDQNFPEKGFINKAIDYGEKVVELSPTHSYFYDNLGLYYMEAALYNEAESTFEKAIELKDDQASSYLHLAEIDIHMERYEQAEKRLRKVLQMSSSQKQTCLAASKLKFVLEEKHK